jgi:peptidoglycan/LPS O-acetylase OafA/YrhL
MREARRPVRTVRSETGFRPDIEGLRAVAVLGVVGYHAGLRGLTGGYVGVDVFFVISGFLITGMLLGDIERRGTFSLKQFYARRARRILPAAGVVLAATSLASACLLSPLRREDVAHDVIASALNVSNWRFIALQTDYLAQGRAQSPLLHYWSLAVEEQFYLAWAPLALLVALVARWLRRSPHAVLAITVGAITLSSFVLCVSWTASNVPLAYLGSPSRAWQFGVGALGALFARRMAAWFAGPGKQSAVAVVLGVAGAAAIVLAMAGYDLDTPYPGTAAALPAVGTIALILAGAGPTLRIGQSGVSRLLALPPIRFVGRLSYTWYLWHWPALIIGAAALRTATPSPPMKLVLAFGSAVPAWVTMRLVENPVRLSSKVASMPWRGLTAGLAAIVLPVAAGLFLYVNAGMALATRGQPQAEAAAATAPASDAPVQVLDEGHLYLPPYPAIPPGAPHPGPGAARSDFPPVGNCQVRSGTDIHLPCLFGDTGSPHRIVLFGDSHAMEWFPALLEIATQRGWAVEVMGKSACPASTMVIASRNIPEFYRACDVWRENALAHITQERPKLIFMGTLMERDYVGQTYINSWDVVLNRLKATGAKLVYFRDTPYPWKDIPDCVSGMPIGSHECDFPKSDSVYPDVMADIVAAGKRPGVYDLDFTNALCPHEACPPIIDGVLVYADRSHITATASRALAPRVEQQMIKLGLLE